MSALARSRPAVIPPGGAAGRDVLGPSAFIETTRALLAGTAPGRHGWLALAWCAVMIAGGYAWARTLYLRKSVR